MKKKKDNDKIKKSVQTSSACAKLYISEIILMVVNLVKDDN